MIGNVKYIVIAVISNNCLILIQLWKVM